MAAYYNEFDPKAAAWLRELIKRKLIAEGEVDERSITDVTTEDVRGFTQCHWFAGIGGWSYALRLAGIEDDYPIWTASLPCQPFSTAGDKRGKDDERHLLPHFLDLVRGSKPKWIFGEQVENAIRHGWLDDLYSVMGEEGYAVGACVMGAHSVGSPHARQRLYWGCSLNVENTSGIRRFTGCEIAGELPEENRNRENNSNPNRSDEALGLTEASSEIGGLWDNLLWVSGKDGKYRAFEPSIRPLVDGVPKGMGRSRNRHTAYDANFTAEACGMRLKGYGNAIVPQVAATFINTFLEITK